MSQYRIQTNSTVLRDQHVKFHPSQQKGAKEILEYYSKFRYVMLAAQMQCGKTGVSMFVAFYMLMRKQVKKVFIISGTSETDLRQQWESNVVTHAYEFWREHVVDNPEPKTCECGEDPVAFYCQDCEKGYCLDCDGTSHTKGTRCQHTRIPIDHHLNSKVSSEGFRDAGHLTKKFEVIWRQDLMKEIGKFDEDYLIIWDESHFATTQKQTLHKFFDAIGIFPDIQGDTRCLERKNSYLLSMSATRCSEQSRMAGANSDGPVKNWKMVVMTPGDNYRGVCEMVEQKLVKE